MKKHFLNLVNLFVLLSLLFISCGKGRDNDTSQNMLNAQNKATGIFINGHECVDLGLPSGIKWATCNVGAASPEEFGGCYAWGEIEEKEDYSWGNYKWSFEESDVIIKYSANDINNHLDKYCAVFDDKTILELEDDVANVKWGSSWRMPTYEEFEELLAESTLERAKLNGVNGYKVIGPNGNSIFLPQGDGCVGGGGDYWSSSLFSSSQLANCMLISKNVQGCALLGRWQGLNVRPVSD